jgi:hypothetical protein
MIEPADVEALQAAIEDQHGKVATLAVPEHRAELGGG